MERLEEAIRDITKQAETVGLDFYDMVYEICPADVLYHFASTGMPNRFSHWSFGKAYAAMKEQYDTGMGKLYEMIINTRPSYAFLLDTNSLTENKLIVAHVLGHSDFFKNNMYFAETNRSMVEVLEENAERLFSFERMYGEEAVEEIVDCALSIQEQPALLSFFIEHSPNLEEWKRQVLRMVQQEFAYLRPQLKTKIMNEGWATYWHMQLMRRLDLSAEEVATYTNMHASVIAPRKDRMNPYLLGLEIFLDIEKRYGKEKLFEVRELESDFSFIRNYLTEEIVKRLDLYAFEPGKSKWNKGKNIVTDTAFESVRDGICQSLINEGFPVLSVDRSGEKIVITHQYDGQELEQKEATEVMRQLSKLWDTDMVIRTAVKGKKGESREIEIRYDSKPKGIHQVYV